MAEINHKFVEQTTNQDHTGDLNWTDVSGAIIASTEFVSGRKYLIVVTAQLRGSNVNDNFGVRLIHGSTPTVFDGSEHVVEPPFASSTDRNPYQFFVVWTASVEDVKLQTKTFDSGETVGLDQITMFKMEISEDLTENTDWFYNENSTQTSLTTTYSSSNNASITVTDGNGDDWLILCTADIRPDATNREFTTRLNRADTDLTPVQELEGEDATNDKHIHTLGRVFKALTGSNAFSTQSKQEASSGATREFSAIFAINLDKFKVQGSVNTVADIDPAASPAYVTEVQTTSVTPTLTGDVWVLGFIIVDFDAVTAGRVRMRVENNSSTEEDQPPTQTSDAYFMPEPSDSVDQMAWMIQTVENLNTNAHKCDMDADGSSSIRMEDRMMIAITMELAPAVAVRTTYQSMVNQSLMI